MAISRNMTSKQLVSGKVSKKKPMKPSSYKMGGAVRCAKTNKMGRKR
jgi:hypothetical protein